MAGAADLASPVPCWQQLQDNDDMVVCSRFVCAQQLRRCSPHTAAGMSQLEEGVGPSPGKGRNYRAAAFDTRDPETPTGKDPNAGILFEEEKRCTGLR